MKVILPVAKLIGVPEVPIVPLLAVKVVAPAYNVPVPPIFEPLPVTSKIIEAPGIPLLLTLPAIVIVPALVKFSVPAEVDAFKITASLLLRVALPVVEPLPPAETVSDGVVKLMAVPPLCCILPLLVVSDIDGAVNVIPLAVVRSPAAVVYRLSELFSDILLLTVKAPAAPTDSLELAVNVDPPLPPIVTA